MALGTGLLHIRIPIGRAGRQADERQPKHVGVSVERGAAIIRTDSRAPSTTPGRWGVTSEKEGRMGAVREKKNIYNPIE